jgi:integral membrane sensor domain MASE1
MGMHPLKLGSLVAFPIAYLLAATMSSGFLRAEDDVALVWLPAGLGYALLLLFGLRWWPLLAGSVLLFHLAVSPVPTLFLGYSAAANTLGALCGAATRPPTGSTCRAASRCCWARWASCS